MSTEIAGDWGSRSSADSSLTAWGNVEIHLGVPLSSPLRTRAAHTIFEPVAGVASRSYLPSSASRASTISIASAFQSSWRPMMSASMPSSIRATHETLRANSALVHGSWNGFMRRPGSWKL